MTGRPLLAEPRLDRPLRDLMSAGVVAVPGNSSLRTAFCALRHHGVHAVLVTDYADGRPLGWLTSRALLVHDTTELTLFSAREAIDEPFVELPPSATAGEAIERMRATGAGRVAVRPDGARLPEGVVADLDLIGLLAEHG